MIADSEGLRAAAQNIDELLASVPAVALPWIVGSHEEYLDNLFYDIGTLSDYLAMCRPIDRERIEFIRFVDSWAYRDNPDLTRYVGLYEERFWATRREVLRQAREILKVPFDEWTAERWSSFWPEFALVNEYDNLHGMFLTSGRWYTNVCVVPIRVLAEGYLAQAGRNTRHAAALAFRVTTPTYAVDDDEVAREDVVGFSRLLRSILPVVDAPVLERSDVAYLAEGRSDREILDEIITDRARFSRSLSKGVFPPFAVQEVRSAAGRKRSAESQLTAPALPDRMSAQDRGAIDALRRLKVLEADYNRFNYKGYFPLYSKYFYWIGIENGYISESDQLDFVRAVLGDRFFEALEVVERSRPE